MLTKLTTVAALLLAAGLAQAQTQPFILVPNSLTDRIMQLSATDGSLINDSFIIDAADPLTYDFGTPKDVIQVGQEIWISDQIADSVFRFDSAGAFLGKIGPAGFDNIRGMAVLDGTVYVTNDGSNNGAPPDSVVMVDVATATITGSFPVAGTSPFDVLVHNGELLVSDFSTDEIYRYSPAGVYLGDFHVSDGITGIDNIQQLSAGPNGTILAAGFSDPDGLYQYDATGAQINYWAVGTGGRGVAVLGNGSYLFTDGDVHSVDPTTGVATLLLMDVGAQYANLFDFSGGQDCPADFDDSGDLTLNDFVQFRNAYVAGDLRADFDGNGSLSLNDFVTFRNEYVAGCP